MKFETTPVLREILRLTNEKRCICKPTQAKEAIIAYQAFRLGETEGNLASLHLISLLTKRNIVPLDHIQTFSYLYDTY